MLESISKESKNNNKNTLKFQNNDEKIINRRKKLILSVKQYENNYYKQYLKEHQLKEELVLLKSHLYILEKSLLYQDCEDKGLIKIEAKKIKKIDFQYKKITKLQSKYNFYKNSIEKSLSDFECDQETDFKFLNIFNSILNRFTKTNRLDNQYEKNKLIDFKSTTNSKIVEEVDSIKAISTLPSISDDFISVTSEDQDSSSSSESQVPIRKLSRNRQKQKNIKKSKNPRKEDLEISNSIIQSDNINNQKRSESHKLKNSKISLLNAKRISNNDKKDKKKIFEIIKPKAQKKRIQNIDSKSEIKDAYPLALLKEKSANEIHDNIKKLISINKVSNYEDNTFKNSQNNEKSPLAKKENLKKNPNIENLEINQQKNKSTNSEQKIKKYSVERPTSVDPLLEPEPEQQIFVKKRSMSQKYFKPILTKDFKMNQDFNKRKSLNTASDNIEKKIRSRTNSCPKSLKNLNPIFGSQKLSSNKNKILYSVESKIQSKAKKIISKDKNDYTTKELKSIEPLTEIIQIKAEVFTYKPDLNNNQFIKNRAPSKKEIETPNRFSRIQLKNPKEIAPSKGQSILESKNGSDDGDHYIFDSTNKELEKSRANHIENFIRNKFIKLMPNRKKSLATIYSVSEDPLSSNTAKKNSIFASNLNSELNSIQCSSVNSKSNFCKNSPKNIKFKEIEIDNLPHINETNFMKSESETESDLLEQSVDARLSPVAKISNLKI